MRTSSINPIGCRCDHCMCYFNRGELVRVEVNQRIKKHQRWCPICRKYAPKHTWKPAR